MRRVMLLAVSTLTLAAPASAQMAVFDVKNYNQIVQQLKAAQDQLTVVTKTYNQAVDAYNEVHGLTQVSGVAQILNSSAAKSILPADMQNIQSMFNSRNGGAGALGQAAANIRAGRKVNLPPLASDASAGAKASRASLDSSGDLAATNAAIAESGFASTSVHTAGLDQLQTALENATTQKDREAIAARIAIEQARIQNNAVQLQALKMRQDAEDQLRAQQAREQQSANLAADAGSPR